MYGACIFVTKRSSCLCSVRLTFLNKHPSSLVQAAICDGVPTGRFFNIVRNSRVRHNSEEKVNIE